jgi:hypothetical protein
MYSKPVEL